MSKQIEIRRTGRLNIVAAMLALETAMYYTDDPAFLALIAESLEQVRKLYALIQEHQG